MKMGFFPVCPSTVSPKKNSDISSNTHFDALKRIKDKQPQLLVEDIEIQVST